MKLTGQNAHGRAEGWKGGRKASPIFQSSIFPIFLFVFLSILNTAFAAPDVPVNFDGWMTDALAKLETNGITGGFHRQTAPLSRAEVAQIVRQAESRVRAGNVVPSEIDRKLLEKLKRAFRRELTGNNGRIIDFLPQFRATEKKIAPALEAAFHWTTGTLQQQAAPRLALYSEFEAHNFEKPAA